MGVTLHMKDYPDVPSMSDVLDFLDDLDIEPDLALGTTPDTWRSETRIELPTASLVQDQNSLIWEDLRARMVAKRDEFYLHWLEAHQLTKREEDFANAALPNQCLRGILLTERAVIAIPSSGQKI